MIRGPKILRTAAIATAATLTASAFAGIETYSGVTPDQTTDGTETFDVPQFDTMGGQRTLEAIHLRLTGMAEGSINIENNSTTESGVFEFQFGANFETLLNGSSLSTIAPTEENEIDLSVFDGVNDFAGPSGAFIPNFAVMQSDFVELIGGADDLSPWIGADIVTLDVAYDNISFVTSAPGAFTFQSLQTASLEWRVDYFFSTKPTNTIIHAGMTDDETLNWNQQIMVPQFDTLGGTRTLQAIEIALIGETSGFINVENQENTPETLKYEFNAAFNIVRGAEPIAQFEASTGGSVDLAAFDGSLDFDGPSGAMIPGLFASESAEAARNLFANDLSPWIGAGIVTLDVNAVSQSFATGTCNLTSQLMQSAKLNWQVTYRYGVPSGADSGGSTGAGGEDPDTYSLILPQETTQGENDAFKGRQPIDVNAERFAVSGALDESDDAVCRDVDFYQISGLIPIGDYTVSIQGAAAPDVVFGWHDKNGNLVAPPFTSESGGSFVADVNGDVNFAVGAINDQDFNGDDDFNSDDHGVCGAYTILIEELGIGVSYFENGQNINDTFEDRATINAPGNGGEFTLDSALDASASDGMCRDVDFFEVTGLGSFQDYCITAKGPITPQINLGWFDFAGQLILSDAPEMCFVADINGVAIIAVSAQSDDDFDSLEDAMMGIHGLCGVYELSFEAVNFDPATHPEDVNRDGVVDTADLSLVIASFGRRGAQLPADVNRDGGVDTADLSLIISAFGTVAE